MLVGNSDGMQTTMRVSILLFVVLCGCLETATEGSQGGDQAGATGASGAGAAQGGMAGVAGQAGQAGVAGHAGERAPTKEKEEKACLHWAQVACLLDQSCDSLRWVSAYGTVETCLERQQKVCVAAVRLLDSHVTAASLEICAGKALPGCGDWLDRVPCTQLEPGELEPGKACSHDWQCQSLYCKRSTLGGCGVCRARQGAGGTCKAELDCLPGLGCVQGTCQLVQQEGEPCSELAPCAPELACVAQPLPSCQPRPALGQACSLAPCLEGTCHQGLCEPWTSIPSGKPCSATGNALCEGGFCDGSTCQPWLEVGAPCSDSPACGPGGVCVAGRCVLASSCAI